jgi:NADH:ubiquinone oxidoreductase subunit K
MITFEHYLILSGAVFALGIYGVLTRRNLVVIFMSIEIMFNGINIALVAISNFINPASLRVHQTGISMPDIALSGHIFALFVITVAAAEIALGLGIVMMIYRRRQSVDATDLVSLKH